MKWLLVAVVLFFQVGSAIAGSCRPIEYAELKDMSSERLVATYCQYGKIISIEQKTRHNLSQLVLEGMQKGLRESSLMSTNKSIADHNASISECFDQQSKINSALENRSEPSPSCEAH